MLTLTLLDLDAAGDSLETLSVYVSQRAPSVNSGSGISITPMDLKPVSVTPVIAVANFYNPHGAKACECDPVITVANFYNPHGTKACECYPCNSSS